MTIITWTQLFGSATSTADITALVNFISPSYFFVIIGILVIGVAGFIISHMHHLTGGSK